MKLYIHIICLFAALVAPMALMAGEEAPDSLASVTEIRSVSPLPALPYDTLAHHIAPLSVSLGRYTDLQSDYIPSKPALTMPRLSFSPGQAIVTSWHSGAIVARGASNTLPALMRIDSGSLGFYQNVGPLSVHAALLANKYGYFRGLHTQYGVEGSLSYRIAPRLTATMFGTYYFGNPPVIGPGLPMMPAMAGFYGTSAFGGYMDVDISDHFGMKVGAQGVQHIGTTRFEPEPIVTPYLKVGSGKNKVQIDLPVGEIHYHTIRSATVKRPNFTPQSTIPPPPPV
ncbi:MAG: hypothetical protein K2M76_01505, partial [Muribaculaceae bacterium]|nr:hypothetical protein [Muribaculaceae bacterium]